MKNKQLNKNVTQKVAQHAKKTLYKKQFDKNSLMEKRQNADEIIMSP